MPKQQIYIATENKGKIAEFKEILKDYDVKSLLDLPEQLDIVEDGSTFEQNALIKAKALAEYIAIPSIGDDSGLEVIGLDNFPGVYSKRWSYPITDPSQRNDMLLDKMQKANLVTDKQRKARYVTVIAYYNPHTKQSKLFRGTDEGRIANQQAGTNGFGYDPIFISDGQTKTFGEIENKNEFSHRRMAIDKFLKWVEQNKGEIE